MKRFFLLIITSILILNFFSSCNQDQKKPEPINSKPETVSITVPQFNADSAYDFVKAQCDFGPRVPNTKTHDDCANYLANKLKTYTSNVIVQKGIVTTFDHVRLNIQNIIASFNPENKNRILLFAHWDTRPWADQDTVDTHKSFLAADDAGSGVAVLLEIARQLSIAKSAVGVDIAFFDAEDWGAKSSTVENEDSYALGTQYWAKNPHVANYSANFGVLLDMVGAHNAKFFMEGNSVQFASGIVKKIWDAGNKSGFSDYFIYKDGGFITDDHLYVNRIINIPSVDIINTTSDGHFASHWHTHRDNMDVIDKNTLRAVGQTLLEVIFGETQI
jgi:hypothetical protein